MKYHLAILAATVLILACAIPAYSSEQNKGIGVMVGYSLAAGNNATEDFALGVKYRLDAWEAAVDIFRAKFPNGGYDKMGVASIDYTWDFARIPEENFGLYGGAGLSWLGAADQGLKDGPAFNVILGYDYTASWSLAGRFYYTFGEGDMFTTGGLTYLF